MTGARAFVSQIGARQHYDVARMCHAAGTLAALHTDFWMPKYAQRMRLLQARRRALGRRSDDIPDTLVRSRPVMSAYWMARLKRARSRHDSYETFAREGRDFARDAVRQFGHVAFDTYFGFASGALEAIDAAKRAGKRAVLDVIAPDEMEDEIIQRERDAFPGWEENWAPIPARYRARIQAERDAADHVVVNSDWSRRAIRESGVSDAKISVVPLSYVPAASADPGPGERLWTPKDAATRKLRVLYLSTLCLRKGVQYLVEAARKLGDAPVEFTLAGPSAIALDSVDLPANCTYVGPVPRVDVARVWRTHDVYILPTLSDGFAITQLEAMAHGLPVIASRYCGDVVEHESSGLLIDAGSSAAIEQAIRRIVDGAFDLSTASAFARKRAAAFHPTRVWKTLSQVLE